MQAFLGRGAKLCGGCAKVVRSFNRASQLFNLAGERLQFGRKDIRIGESALLCDIKEGIEHHRQAGENGLFDLLEGVFDAYLLVSSVHEQELT